MTEADVKKIVKDIVKSEFEKFESNMKKTYIDEDVLKKIVRQMFINHSKWMWEKSSVYINKL